jgi:hypothetical protein
LLKGGKSRLTIRGLDCRFLRTGELAAQAPTPHAHIREDQDDEDDREDDVGEHLTSNS